METRGTVTQFWVESSLTHSATLAASSPPPLCLHLSSCESPAVQLNVLPVCKKEQKKDENIFYFYFFPPVRTPTHRKPSLYEGECWYWNVLFQKGCYFLWWEVILVLLHVSWKFKDFFFSFLFFLEFFFLFFLFCKPSSGGSPAGSPQR